jgi:hypothetical protein
VRKDETEKGWGGGKGKERGGERSEGKVRKDETEKGRGGGGGEERREQWRKAEDGYHSVTRGRKRG